MDALTLIEKAIVLGLTLSLNGDQVEITGPRTPAAAALVQQMASHKAGIIAILAPALADHMGTQQSSTERTIAEIAMTERSVVQPVQRPPLPARFWQNEITNLEQARTLQVELARNWCTSLGKNGETYFVRCPGWQDK